MTRRLLVCAVVLALPLAAYGEDRSGKLPPVPTNSAFEKLKKLAGTWLAADNAASRPIRSCRSSR